MFFYITDSTIGTIKARDSDGPMPIIFSIQDEKTKQLVRLGETTGDSATQRQVDIILITPLDRDRVKLFLFRNINFYVLK